MVQLDISIRTPGSRESESDFVVPMLIDLLAPGEFVPIPTYRVRTDADNDIVLESPSDSDVDISLTESGEPTADEFLVGRILGRATRLVLRRGMWVFRILCV